MSTGLKRIIVCFTLILGLVFSSSLTLSASNNLLLNGSFEETGATDMSVADTELLYFYGDVRVVNIPNDRWPSDWVLGGKPRDSVLDCNGVVEGDAIDGLSSLKLSSDDSSLRLVACSDLFEVDPSKQYKVNLWVKVLSCPEGQANQGGWFAVSFGLYKYFPEELKVKKIRGIGDRGRGYLRGLSSTFYEAFQGDELAIGEWRELTFTMGINPNEMDLDTTIPSEVEYANIMMTLEYCTNVILLVDNIKVTVVGEEPPINVIKVQL